LFLIKTFALFLYHYEQSRWICLANETGGTWIGIGDTLARLWGTFAGLRRVLAGL